MFCGGVRITDSFWLQWQCLFELVLLLWVFLMYGPYRVRVFEYFFGKLDYDYDFRTQFHVALSNSSLFRRFAWGHKFKLTISNTFQSNESGSTFQLFPENPPGHSDNLRVELVLEPDHAMSHGTFRPKPQLLDYLQGLLGMPPTSLPGSRLLVAGGSSEIAKGIGFGRKWRVKCSVLKAMINV